MHLNCLVILDRRNVLLLTRDLYQLQSLTYSGTVRQSYGGVGRNIADCLSRLGQVPLFISRVGQDVAGKAFIEQFKHMVCRCTAVK